MTVTTDIVTALRSDTRLSPDPIAQRAADDIERLRASLAYMLKAYWGKGDGEPAPEFIREAAALCNYQLDQ